jgi:hypothetical protein
MIGDGRWHDAAGFQAQPAERLDHQLMCATALPAGGAIPV